MIKPSEKQKEVLKAFVLYAVKNYCSPTLKELAEILNQNVDNVAKHIANLKVKGYIKANGRHYQMTEKCRKEYKIMSFEEIKQMRKENKMLKKKQKTDGLKND